MDGVWFDGFTRRLVASGTRRAALRALAGIVLVAGTERLSAETAVAAPCKPGQPCSVCKGLGKPCGRRGGLGSYCCPGSTCKGGKCACKTGLTNCQGRCKDLQSDEAHCGSCATQCDRNQVCVFGKCCINTGGTCSQDSQCCSGLCLGGECIVF